MKKIIFTEEELKSLLRNTYNQASIQTENHIKQTKKNDFPLNQKATEFINKVIPSLKFN